MATILGRITLNGVAALEVDANPGAGAGTEAPLGSYASVSDGSGLYLKDGLLDTDWTMIGGSPSIDAWVLGGNTNGVERTIGTNDAFDFVIETGGTERFRIDSATSDITIAPPPPNTRTSINLGGAAFSFGLNASANGFGLGFAIGFNANASGGSALAIGPNTVASNTGAVAVGDNADATTANSAALGVRAQATGSAATAFGSDAQATQLFSVAIGALSQATGDSAIAIGGGSSTQATGASSIALGRESDAGFADSVAIGRDATTTTTNQMVVGDPARELDTVINGTLSLNSSVAETSPVGTYTTTGANGDSIQVFVGQSDPSAAAGVTAPVGSLFHRDSGGLGTTGELYLKTGAADTAWTDVSSGGGGAGSLQDAYVGGNTIVTSATEGPLDVSGTEAISLDAQSASNFTVDTANLTLQTLNGGVLQLLADSDVDLTSADGDILITAGTFPTGGNIDITAGAGVGATQGGDITVFAGNSGAGATGDGGGIFYQAGDSVSTAGDGGEITFVGGSTTNGDGGNIVLTPGSGAGAGTDGEVIVNGKLTVTGLIDPTGLVLTEQGVDPASTSTGFGTFWVRSDAPNVPMFTDDTGVDWQLSGLGTSAQIVYRPGGTAGGNIYTTWASAHAAAAAYPGLSTLRIDSSLGVATVTAGAWDMAGIVLSGFLNLTVTGSTDILNIADGATFSNLDFIYGPLQIISASTTSVITYASDAALGCRLGVFLGATTAPFITVNPGATLSLTLMSASQLLNSGANVVQMGGLTSNLNVQLYDGSRISPNTLTGTASSVTAFVSGTSNSFTSPQTIVPAATIFLQSNARFLSYSNLVSGLAATNVQDAIDELVGGEAEAITFAVNQVGHGFSALDALTHDGAAFTLAQANSGTTLGYWIVVEVIDVDNFRVAYAGQVTVAAHGLTPGDFYFVSPTVAGALTATEPTTVGQFTNPLVYVRDANTLEVLAFRPSEVLSPPTAVTLQSAYDNGNIVVTSGASGDFDVSGTEGIFLNASVDSNFTVAGGDLNLQATAGGSVFVLADEDAEVRGGNTVLVRGTDGTGTNPGAPVSITAGDATGGNANGGNVNVTTGTGFGTGVGGNLNLVLGDGGAGGGSGGNFNVTPGSSSTAVGAMQLIPAGTGVGETTELRFRELLANGNSYVGFKAPDALAGSVTWTLPDADGPSGAALTTDGAGTLSFLVSSMAPVVFRPQDSQPPVANFATLSTRNTTRPHPVLEFDPLVNESTDFAGYMPDDYHGGNLEVTVVWAATSSLGTVDWNVSWEREDDGVYDLDNNSFAAAQTGSDTAPGAQGVLTYTTITFTNAQADSISAGECFRLQVERDAVTDTNAGDAQVIRVIVREVV